VIARYLTDAGKALGDTNLAVSLTEIERNERGGGVFTTVAECSACPAVERFHWENGKGLAEAGAREWAQAHAEKCRAMPRPEAGGR
jgi:hypothetical protein